MPKAYEKGFWAASALYILGDYETMLRNREPFERRWGLRTKALSLLMHDRFVNGRVPDEHSERNLTAPRATV